MGKNSLIIVSHMLTIMYLVIIVSICDTIISESLNIWHSIMKCNVNASNNTM